MSLFYKMDPHTHAVEPCTLAEWSDQFENPERRIIKRTAIAGFTVSTVFMGLATGIAHGDGSMNVFETMVFGGAMDRHQERAATYADAIRMHDAVVSMASARGYAEVTRRKVERARGRG